MVTADFGKRVEVGVESDDGRGHLHVWKVGDGAGSCRRVADVIADIWIEEVIEGLQLGWVGAGHVDGERRLRPPGGGDGAHGQATHQTDEQHDG
jgi:hypothetical protein